MVASGRLFAEEDGTGTRAEQRHRPHSICEQPLTKSDYA